MEDLKAFGYFIEEEDFFSELRRQDLEKEDQWLGKFRTNISTMIGVDIFFDIPKRKEKIIENSWILVIEEFDERDNVEEVKKRVEKKMKSLKPKEWERIKKKFKIQGDPQIYSVED